MLLKQAASPAWQALKGRGRGNLGARERAFRLPLPLNSSA